MDTAAKRIQPHDAQKESPVPEGQFPVRKLVYTLSDAERESTGLKTLPITLTLPADGTLDSGAVSRPLIMFHHGFKAVAVFYALYTRGLAAHGFTVLQYDLPWYKNTKVEDEVDLAPGLFKWLQTLGTEHHDLAGLRDLNCVGVTGHSRGAKLAVLIYAKYPELVQAAFLIDPVDNAKPAPKSIQFPEAIRVVEDRGLAVAVAGSGVTGHANPKGSNFQEFYAAAAPSSWRIVVHGAGHAQFFKGFWIVNKLGDLLCGHGNNSHAEAISLTLHPMIAWFDQHLRPDDQLIQARPESSFLHWVKTEQALGKITFSVKQ